MPLTLQLDATRPTPEKVAYTLRMGGLLDNAHHSAR